MKALWLLCGIAVLLNALHLAHAIHHFWSLDPDHGMGFRAGLAVAIAVGVLSFTGGCLLIREAGRRGTGRS